MIDRSLSDPDLEGTVRVVSASATHVGHVRATNEDSLLTATPIHLVADGALAESYGAGLQARGHAIQLVSPEAAFVAGVRRLAADLPA